ncbi:MULTISPECIES: inositol monophosphatase family protein [unclassified Coleofasciculus]|uniref:inositol monophosphatase family protein n=1 Tax=unclassified Coleofasciculus TaxID=2692782 RepID=UPI001882B3A2|nr:MULTISPECIES: inositol monophosphatase family protein [unclassified Coleofasciculus]MBE9125278.1 inositol monophosphatase [Coleofasciculus sp. LEGE 07081]MBE9147059.1 inositol monophosphatase [Coleofasciculus sp. LEGE 07092]
MSENQDSCHLAQRYLAACAIARCAGKLALRYFADLSQLTIEVKGIQDVTSKADHDVEELIISNLAQSFPEDGFLAEERGGVAGSQFWVIDPIDGTSNFVRGIPFFCIAIAYVLERQIEIGIVYDPVADELFAARRGCGATCNGKPIQVSKCSELAKATVTFDFHSKTPIDRCLTITRTLLEAHCNTRSLGAGALAIAQVADGHFDGYWNLHHYPWDALAGLLLVQEAGGWTSDFLVGKGLTEGNPVLVCTPGIRDTLIAATGIR